MADIGTDHGFLPLHCLQEGLVSFAVLSDVNEGPLARAAANLQASGISSDRYSLRLGGGLKTLALGEAETVVIAGMGGELIARILEESPEVCCSVRRLILQPRTRSGHLRRWLWENGWEIDEEHLVRENGRLCEVFTARRGSQKPYVYADIPACQGELMAEFLDKELVNINQITENLKLSKTPENLQRISFLEEKAAYLAQRRDELWKDRCF